MEPIHYFLLIIISLGAGFVQRVSGFGLSIFTMMFFPYFMPTQAASVTISTILSSGTTTFNTIRYRKDIAFKTALPMIIAALISIPIAVYFSAKVTADIFKILLGSVLIILSLYFLFFSKKVNIKPTTFNGILSGTISGTLGGLFSTSGPPAVLYLTNALKDNKTYFATIQFYFCLTNLYSIIMRFVNGLVTWEMIFYSAIGFVGCMAGDFLGKLVFDKLNAQKLRYIIYVGMIISGIIMLF